MLIFSVHRWSAPVPFLPIRVGSRRKLTPFRESCHRPQTLHASVSKSVEKSVLQKTPETGEVLDLSELTAIGPLDGRYGSKLKALRGFFSEYGLIRYRVFVECSWLQYLSKCEPLQDHAPHLTSSDWATLERLKTNFTLEDAQKVKEYEKTTNHDVKAVEYYLKECLKKGDLSSSQEFVHFGCTSEDINNLAYGLMIKEALSIQIVPLMEEVVEKTADMAEEYSDVSMLAKTHGQPASPTTMGKELANFAFHLAHHIKKIKDIEILGKMAGAVGNYNAHYVAFKEVDWPELSCKFVESLGLDWNPYVTQIEPHYYIAEVFHGIERFNTIMLDFDRDIWGYISLNYFRQRVIQGEVGSSTMPHKINPIDFENSEGNLGVANALLHHLAAKLPVSRFQRDLSDSTVLRNIGVAIGHSLLAYQSTLKGLGKLYLDQEVLQEDLQDRWELLSEAIQTVMRKYQIAESYERLKHLTRGKKTAKQDIQQFVESIEDISAEDQVLLISLSPENYTGNAKAQARKVKDSIKNIVS